MVVLLFLGHLLGLVSLIRNQRWLKWPAKDRCPPASDASLCVIVPARNEAGDIATCLGSSMLQDYPRLTVFVVNVHSSDDTPQIIDEIAANHRCLIAIHDPPLRPGWLGKQNAMQAAWEQVDRDLVLLTDADVEFNPTCLSLAVGEFERRNLDFISLYPQFRFVSFCETMLLPFYVGGTAILLSPAIEDPQSPRAMATGAFILMRADRLQQIGGFEAIKTDILAIVPLMIYGLLLFAVFYGLATRHFWIAGVSVLNFAVIYFSMLLTHPGDDFSALKALVFPLMSLQFAAFGLRAAYLLIAEGTFQWRGRSTDLRAVRNEAGTRSHVSRPVRTRSDRDSSSSARWS